MTERAPSSALQLEVGGQLEVGASQGTKTWATQYMYVVLRIPLSGPGPAGLKSIFADSESEHSCTSCIGMLWIASAVRQRHNLKRESSLPSQYTCLYSSEAASAASSRGPRAGPGGAHTQAGTQWSLRLRTSSSFWRPRPPARARPGRPLTGSAALAGR